MKKILIQLIPILMCFNLFSQKIVYDNTGTSKPFTKEDTDIAFTDSGISIRTKPSQEITPLLAALIPTAVDLGFKITNNLLEKRKKKFSGEYALQRSYLEAGTRKIPNIEFTRTATIDKVNQETLKISIDAALVPIDNTNALGFVYSVRSIDLHYSKAKVTRKDNTLDYTIEIKPTFFVEGEKKSQEVFPIIVSSVSFGNNSLPEKKFRTDIIPLPLDAFFAEVAVKIVETNPANVKTEKIIEAVTNYKDDAKTIINNIIENSKKDESAGEEGNDDEPDGNDNEGDNNKK